MAKINLLKIKVLDGICPLILLLICYVPGFSQSQLIGRFPEVEGGFEKFAPSPPLPISSVTYLPAVQYSNYFLNTATFNSGQIASTSPRSGSRLLQWAPRGNDKLLLSPTATDGAILNNTSYVVQFYYATSSSASFPVGVTPTVSVSVDAEEIGAVGPVVATDIASTATGTSWTKKTIIVNSGTSSNSPRYGEIIFNCDSIGSNNIYFDDLVMYAGSAADVTAPGVPTGISAPAASTTSVTVNWTAPVSGVDGGGYIVVRGIADPATAPNANGIYGVGNTLGVGTVVYTGTSTSFTDVGLTNGTSYYYRVYSVDKAFNYSSAATVIGIPHDLGYALVLTSNSNVQANGTTFISGGNIISDGGVGFPVIARGVVWSTSIDPTIPSINSTVDASGIGSYISSLNGMALGTLYYLRAYATTAAGTSYGPNVSFTTLDYPTLSTSPVVRIAFSSVTSGGTLSSAGNTACSMGVCWNRTGSPTVADSVLTDAVLRSSAYTFVSNIEGLAAGTKYYVRAYATNVIGTVYGQEQSFTTFNACYNVAGADVSQLSGWNSMPDGSGVSPSNFTTDSLVYNVRNPGAHLGDNLVITGVNSRLAVGDGSNPMDFTIPSNYTYTGLIDVRKRGTLYMQNTQNPTYNILYDSSTVNFDGSGTLSFPINVNFFNLGSTNDAGASRILQAGTTFIAGAFSPGSATYSVDPANFVQYNGSSPQLIAPFNYQSLYTNNPLGCSISGTSYVRKTLRVRLITIPTNSTLIMEDGASIVMSPVGILTVKGTLEQRSINGFLSATGGGVLNVADTGIYKINGYIGNALFPATGMNFLTGSTLYIATGQPQLPASLGGNVVWDVSGTGVGNTTFLRTSGGDNTTIGGNLTIKATGTGTLINGWLGTTGRNLVVNGNLDMQGGEYDVNYAPSVDQPQTLTVKGKVTISGGKLYASANTGAKGVIYIGGNLVDNTGFIGNKSGYTNGTIHFNGTSPQTIATLGFANEVPIVVNNSAGVTLLTNTNINATTPDALTLTNGSLKMGTNILTLKGGFNRTAGTLDAATGTLILSGIDLQTIPASTIVSNTIKNLVINNSSGVNAATSLKIVSDLTLTSGTFDIAANNLNIGGNINRTLGVTEARNGSSIVFDGSSLQTVAESAFLQDTLNNLTVNHTGAGVVSQGSLKVGGALALTAGTLDIGVNTLGIGGSFTRTAGNINAGVGSVIMNGSLAQTIPASSILINTIKNLTVNNNSGVVSAGSLKVLTDISLMSGVFDFGVNTLNIGGTITPATGIINAVAGSLIFDGNTPQIIPLKSLLSNTVKNLTVNNSSGVNTAIDSIQVTNTMAFDAGTLGINNNILGIGGDITRISGNLDAQNGSVIFNGYTLQTIPSSVFAGNLVRKFTAYNAAGIDLNAVSTIKDTFALSNGIVTTSTGILTLETNAIVGGSPGLNSFVNGPMSKKTNTTGEFEFPVGKKGSPDLYRPISIIPTETAGSTFTAEYNRGTTPYNNSPFLASLYGLVNTEHWALDRSAGSDKAQVKLNYLNPGSGNWTPTDPDMFSNVAVAQYNNSGGYWAFANVSGAFDGSRPDYRYYTDNGVIYTEPLNNFSIFTAGFSLNVILPISLLNFDGRFVNGDALLKWNISNAKDIIGFEVQYCSDGRNFKHLGDVTLGSGTSYSYTHHSLPAGLNYYRLKIKEKNGKISLSQVVIVANGKASTLITGLKQTVVNNDVTALIYSAKNQLVYTVVTDNLGHRITSYNDRISEGNNQLKVPVLLLSRGMYYISISTEDGVQKTLKFIK